MCDRQGKGLRPSPGMAVHMQMGIRPLLQNSFGWRQRGRVGLRPHRLQGGGGGGGLGGGPTGKRDTGKAGVQSQLCFSCCAPAQALGTERLLLGPAGPHPGCVSPPTPATWLSATEEASVSGGRGHVWGQVYRLVGVGEQIPGKQGITSSVPRGPRPGEQLSLLPSLLHDGK